MKSADVAKWSASDWRSKITYLRPSGGGAVGVLFCWTAVVENLTFDHLKLGFGNPDTCDFIVKPIKGSAAPTKVAEQLLHTLADTGSPNSKPIARTSSEGQAILDLVGKFKTRADQGKDLNGLPAVPTDLAAKERVDKLKARWLEVLDHYRNADYFLIQDYVANKLELGDELRTQSGLRYFLRNETLMVNLGKLFVADAVLGNGDRLCQVNSGNIMFTRDGRLWAIDSTTVLTKYDDVVNDFTTQSWGEFMNATPTPRQWGNTIVTHGAVGTPSPSDKPAYLQGHQPKVPPGFAMKILFEPDRWFTDTFKGHMLKSLLIEEQELKKTNPRQPPPIPPKNEEWENARIWFKRGVEDGLKKVDQKLSGLNWLAVKSKYTGYVNKYGRNGSNVDWTNFKIRRMYIKTRLKGKTEEEALAVVEEYAARKYDGV